MAEKKAHDTLSEQIADTLVLYEMKTPGTIHKDAIPPLLKELGIDLSPAELPKFMAGLASSTAANGFIAKAAIEKAIDPLLRRLEEKKLSAYLMFFDRDKDGKISAEDLNYALTTSFTFLLFLWKSEILFLLTVM